MKKESVLILFVSFFCNLVGAVEPCSQLLNVFFKYDPQKKTALLKDFTFLESEFCDRGTQELNSNFKIVLLKKNEVFLSKQVYLNTMTVLEPLEKDSKTFKKNKVELSPQFRNVKFSVKKNQVDRYIIYSIPENLVIGSGEIR